MERHLLARHLKTYTSYDTYQKGAAIATKNGDGNIIAVPPLRWPVG